LKRCLHSHASPKNDSSHQRCSPRGDEARRTGHPVRRRRSRQHLWRHTRIIRRIRSREGAGHADLRGSHHWNGGGRRRHGPSRRVPHDVCQFSVYRVRCHCEPGREAAVHDRRPDQAPSRVYGLLQRRAIFCCTAFRFGPSAVHEPGWAPGRHTGDPSRCQRHAEDRDPL